MIVDQHETADILPTETQAVNVCSARSDLDQ